MVFNLLSFASVMKSVGGIILAVVILLAMVTIHEFGHYLAGKLLGFKINEFAVGFGPAILKKRSKKTGELFALRIIPLGGYCAFDGEDYDGDEASREENKEDDQEPFEELSQKENDGGRDEVIENEQKNEPTMSALNEDVKTPSADEKKPQTEEYPEPKGKRFNDQAPWKRIIVLVAGATMNYLLALLLIILMFACIGRPMYTVMERPADTGTEATAIFTETEASDALLPGDIILKIDGHNVYMITDYIDALDGKKAGEAVAVDVLRDGEEKTVTMQLGIDANFVNMSDTMTLLQSMGVYGLAPVTVKQGFFSSIGHSFGYSVKIGGTVLRSLGELLTGKLGLDAMGGPITTIQVTSQAASSGMLSFLNIAAFIGVNLAVFNLLPIPALDGCKVIFCLIEWIRKKPINRKVETIIHLVGIVFLFGFAILVDLLQLF